MKKYFRISFLLLIYFSLISCTTLGILSEEEKKVKIAFSKNLIKDCHFIDGFLVGSLYNPNATLKKKAFKMGGDMVLIPRRRRFIAVEVYHCSEQPPKIEENVQAEENQESVNSPE